MSVLQDLTLTITSERSESELDLEEDSSEISSINVQSFVDEQEWKLHSHIETWKRLSNKAYQNSKHKHPAFSTSCRASRRPGFFIWNIFLVMVIIAAIVHTYSDELNASRDSRPGLPLTSSFLLEYSSEYLNESRVLVNTGSTLTQAANDEVGQRTNSFHTNVSVRIRALLVRHG